VTHPTPYAARFPDKPAVVVADTGAVLTYRELDDQSKQLAQAWHAAGLRPGDHVASIVGNHVRNLVGYWAAMRSGLYFTPINTYLRHDEAAFVVENCQASALIVEARFADLAAGLIHLPMALRLSLDGPIDGHQDYDDVMARYPAEPLTDEPLGKVMAYSSGSTGRPKGIKRPLTGASIQDGDTAGLDYARRAYAVGEDTVCLSPAPLYHAAPLSFAAAVIGSGGTFIIMERFDPERFLAAVAQYRVTHALVVPTMFVRLLRLPADVRAAADVGSLRFAMHGASPCPVPVKRAMIDWWGPVITEYYAGSEDNGSTVISSAEWLEHPGSVGQAFGDSVIHICDAMGVEQPAGTDGIVYFESPSSRPFEYHGEGGKTSATRHPVHPAWTTLGDVGHLDDDGYLYLTDRTDYMIISGGVNISPQEIENVMIEHPDVLDVAVIGVPNEEFGEEVKAVVQPAEAARVDDLPERLRTFVHERLARHKVPRTVDLVDALPRSPAGKLYKRQLREKYLTTTHRKQ